MVHGGVAAAAVMEVEVEVVVVVVGCFLETLGVFLCPCRALPPPIRGQVRPGPIQPKCQESGREPNRLTHPRVPIRGRWRYDRGCARRVL